MTQAPTYKGDDSHVLRDHAAQIRELAAYYGEGLVDSFAVCMAYAQREDLSDILSWSNHPNRVGHDLVAKELVRWFPAG